MAGGELLMLDQYEEVGFLHYEWKSEVLTLDISQLHCAVSSRPRSIHGRYVGHAS